MKYNLKRDIYAPGELTSLAESVLAGIPVKELNQLTTNEMHRIPEIYAQVPYTPQGNIGSNSILDVIEADKVYKTGNGHDILGGDIKAITSLMYLKPRTSYWKPDKPQIHDSGACGAVPLPLLGFKTWKGIPYNGWLQAMLVHRAEGYDTYDSEMDIEDMYHLDLLLGNTLASTKYIESKDEIDTLKGYGLAALGYFEDEIHRPNYNDVRLFREGNMGNLRGAFANTYGTVSISEDNVPEDNEIQLERVRLHNKCTTPMRLLLSQRWVWYGYHRNTDMIMDFQNWDNMPKSIDTMSMDMKGIEPTEDNTSQIRARFGIG